MATQKEVVQLHKDVKIIQRSKGKSAVAAASYRAGVKIYDRRTGLTHDYTRKGGVVHSEILAPPHAPRWVYDRAELWNRVEEAARRGDAQLAREFEFSLMHDFSEDRNENFEINLRLIREHLVPLVDQGMIVDFNIHDPKETPSNPRNLHCHVLVTMRDIYPDGFGNNNREWNPDFRKKKGSSEKHGYVADIGPLVALREKWAKILSSEYRCRGINKEVTHLSYEDQGSDKIPQPHVGPRAVKWGDESRLAEQRRLIQEHNHVIDDIEKQARSLGSMRPFLRPTPNVIQGKKEYKKRLVEEKYQAAITPWIHEQIRYVHFPVTGVVKIDLYGGGWVKDYGPQITARHADYQNVVLMFDLAEAKGWQCVDIKGDREYLELAKEEAKKRGIRICNVRSGGGGNEDEMPCPKGLDSVFDKKQR